MIVAMRDAVDFCYLSPERSEGAAEGEGRSPEGGACPPVFWLLVRFSTGKPLLLQDIFNYRYNYRYIWKSVTWYA
jgi:hypothetical protein